MQAEGLIPPGAEEGGEGCPGWAQESCWPWPQWVLESSLGWHGCLASLYAREEVAFMWGG